MIEHTNQLIERDQQNAVDDGKTCESLPSCEVDGMGTLSPSAAETVGRRLLSDAPSGHVCLVVRNGATRGTAFLLYGSQIVGRQAQCDIVLNDATVSRHHAQLELAGDRYTIADLGSLNGTYVNRAQVESTELTSGDEVQIGKFKLLYVSQ